MSCKRLARSQIHRIELARALAPLGATWRDSLKLVLLALVEPLRSRSRWRGRPVSLSVSLGDARATFETIGRTDLEVAREIFVSHEYEMTRRTEEMTILDLGAHIGLASIYFSHLFPNARIIAVEADPELLDVLRENVRSLPVRVIHGAVSAESGERNFYRSDQTWSNSVERTRETQEEIVVPAITLEEIRQIAGIAEVSLMKFDVEGAEWEFLEDGLPEFVDAAIGEVHGDRSRDPREMVERIAESRCISIRRADRSRAVLFASNKCTRLREPLLGIASSAAALL